MKNFGPHKKIAILQSNYIPWKGYFDIINSVDEFIIYDCVQYTKNDWRSRNIIKVPEGAQWLTIPVYHKLHQRIDETVIADKNWAKKHWKTLLQNYSKAKYFEEYKEVFESLYESAAGVKHLSIINRMFIIAIVKLLGIQTKLLDSSKFGKLIGGKTERLIDICKIRNADVYVSGRAAEDYLDVALMNQNDIQVEWMDYNYEEYGQLYPPFIHGVTILDLLFNEGPEAINHLKN